MMVLLASAAGMPCQICDDAGRHLAHPRRNVSEFLSPFTVNELCSVLSEELCDRLPPCGCPLERPDVLSGSSMTCEDLELILSYQQADSELCDDNAAIFASECGCAPTPYPGNFLGAFSPRQQTILVWTPRISGIISALSSLWIIGHVILTHGSHYTVFHELIMSMSVCDILVSTADALSTLPIPRYDDNGDPTGFLGARGTEATCTAQGFLIELGLIGGVVYNLALSFYHLLMIRYRWREDRLRRVARMFHIPMVIGVCFALAGIPYYVPAFVICWILPVPNDPQFAQIFSFVILPIGLVMVAATTNVALVYHAVRRQRMQAKKWTMAQAGSKRRPSVIMRMERSVFWQGAFFLGAFYTTWGFLLASFFIVSTDMPFEFWVLVFTLAPLQGFWNCLVYMRPRVLQRIQGRRSSRATSDDRSGPFESPQPLCDDGPRVDDVPEPTDEPSGMDFSET